MSRRDWTEAYVNDAEHVARVVTRLVSEECRFDVRPEPGGWWRIRADLPTNGEDTTGLHWVVQTTRLTVAE